MSTGAGRKQAPAADPGERRWWRVLRRQAPLLLVLLTGAVLRLVRIGHQSIGYDELAFRDSGPFVELLRRFDFASEKWGHLPQIPVISRYFFGVLPQVIFGVQPNDPDANVIPRTISALFGVLAVWLAFVVGRRMKDARFGWLAAVLVACSPPIISHHRMATIACIGSVPALTFVLFALRYEDRHAWRDMGFAALACGMTFAVYFRLGLGLWGGAFGWVVISAVLRRKGWTARRSALFLGACALACPVVLCLTYPYCWFHFLAFWARNFAEHRGELLAKPGPGPQEFFLGALRETPWYYYFVVLAFSLPALLLVATAWGSVRECMRWKRWSAMWLPMGIAASHFFVATWGLRQCNTHYLQHTLLFLSFPAAGALYVFGDCLAGKWPRLSGARWLPGIVMGIYLLGNCIWIHPEYLDYFNELVGGPPGVYKHRLLPVGWYGEGSSQTLEWLSGNAESNATVLARFGPWPGLFSMRKNLRADLKFYGTEAVSAVGPDYVAMSNLELANPFYRYEADETLYEPVHYVTAAGAPIAVVFKRKVDPRLVYRDDYANFGQVRHHAKAFQNLHHFPWPNGKLVPAKAGALAGLVYVFDAPAGTAFRKCEFRIGLNVRPGDRLVVFAGPEPRRLRGIADVQPGTNLLELKDRAEFEGQRRICLGFQLTAKQDGPTDAARAWDYTYLDKIEFRADRGPAGPP
ncbi:MAG: glycosyltransferase family 39 protein [Kiritimatiellae bacterium]|nr:glycosyltransferase family 39 protein [Kiritimatiellia bacterium]